MLYMVGPLRIETWPFNVTDVGQYGGADFAVKPVVGAEQPVEFVGEGSNELSLEGVIWPSERDGPEALYSLEMLGQMRASGRPQYVMRGDGRPLGWHVITSVATRSDYLDVDGVGRRVKVSIDLRRAPRPSAQTFFSLVSRLLG